MTTDRVLVTGASGFVGQHVVSTLLGRGYAVRALVHKNPDVPAGVEAVRADLSDPASLTPLCRDVQGVVHAAALLDPISDPEQAERINHQGSVLLAHEAAKAGARAFVFLSTQAAIGYHTASGLVRTDAEPRPTTTYGQSKLAAEQSLLGAALGAMRVVILRPPTVYGPGEMRNFLALTRAVDTGLFLVPGSGENRMSFCAVENLAAACAFSLETRDARGVLHIADEPALRFRQIVSTLAWALGRPLPPVPFPLPVAHATALLTEAVFGILRRHPPLSRARLHTLTSDSALDTSATHALGFRPPLRFSEGVCRTVAFYRDRGLVPSR